MIVSLLKGLWRGMVLPACLGLLLCANASWAEVNIAAERGRLVVAQEPAEAFTPTAAKEKLTAAAQAPLPRRSPSPVGSGPGAWNRFSTTRPRL